MRIDEKDKICLWCGGGTHNNLDKEHIFPECIGGKERLPLEYVCKKCNQEFSDLDESLKREHPAMLDAYQVDKGIIGKQRGQKDKARKEKERTHIRGKGAAASTEIKRHLDDSGQEITELVDTNYIVTSESFVRSLHKCLANILCDHYGPCHVRENYPELLNFVRNGGDIRPWSYAVSYPRPFGRALISEPTIITDTLLTDDSGKEHAIVSFIHTSGVWIVGSSPFLLNRSLIEETSNLVSKELACSYVKDPTSKNPPRKLTNCFGFDRPQPLNDREIIGEVGFLWMVQEIEGVPDDDFLFLLTRCGLCGQTNPTGFTFPRSLIYSGDTNNTTQYNHNTWNQYTDDDLKKLGLKIEFWDAKNLEKHRKQGISIPQENDIKNTKIVDCQCRCINCNNLIMFNSNDCFI